MGQLEDTLFAVALSRRGLEHAQAQQAELQAAIDATEDGQRLAQLKEDVAALTVVVSQDAARARQQITVAFRLTGNKKPAPGASIRMVKTVAICGDTEDVKEWAILHAPHVLTIHEPTLKKQILAGGVPEDLATITEQPNATLARDLSSWLVELDAEA